MDENGSEVQTKIPPLALAVGKPFDFAAERESLRQLYKLGDFSDISVRAAPEESGVRVDFVVQRNFYNNVVRIEGLKEPPTAAAAQAALHLELGQPYRESALLDGIQHLQDELRSEGLYLANVKWSLAAHEDTREMDITITVDPGPRAKIGNIIIDNQTPYTDKELLHRSKIKTKQELTSSRISRATQRLKQYLVREGYLGASTAIKAGSYDAKTNLVPVTFSVTTGPRVRVAITGAHLRKGQVRKLLPIYAEGSVDEDLLQEGRRNIREYFQRQGYFDANVTVRSDEAPNNLRVILYDIDRGSRSRVAGIAFQGNKYFSAGLLEGSLQIQTASFASSGKFSQQLLRADIDSIRTIYVSNGFRDAQVTADVNDSYGDKKANLFVTFRIVEGAQSRVASLKIEGNHAISTTTLLGVVGSSEGQPYSPESVASDRNNILALYFNEGFPQAHFQEVVTPVSASEPNRMNVAYHITEGEQISVSKVLLTGYQFTRPGIIRRQVEIHPGGPLREGNVVDTQRRLYNLGVFTRVQIAPQNPDGTDPEKVVVVDTQEGKRYTIGYGFGFEVQRIGASCSSNSTTCDPNATQIAESPRGIFEIARSNMFGRAQTLSFKARASTLEYRAALGYTADNFLTNRSLSLQLTGFAEKTQDVTTFTSTRYEGALQLVEKISPFSALLYRYFYRHVTAADLKVTPEEVPLLSQPTLVSGVGITYARDHRDNPSDPQHGTFNTADVSVASTKLGSGASFFRGFFQNSSFTSFGRAFVFARSVRFGVEEPFGSTVEGNTPFDISQCTAAASESPPEVIPLPERFFAGGGTSIRGFGLNQAGPRDPCSGFPVGGLAILALNQELRFPMRLPFVGNRLGGTVFYDGGNVYTDFNHISLAWKPPSVTELNYFSHTVGFGLRYPTPVGPVRVDFGYQINPALYQFYNATTAQLQNIRLPHFEFSFNIGPVF
ncbi:MAG TPA: POTRA domain-containing protein [Candidatus Limnocylindrales bacterium]|nr:POTRA domain-containing protein [Candidatus Limnocylindrales bacterium]